ncbi:MAG TPA: LuxR family transcriptional regulator, partial [Phenylobacterium sp.]
WTGGVAGGTDEQLARRFAALAGADPQSLVYAPRAGAGEVAAALQVGDSDLVGVATFGELAPYATDGRIRLLAVAAPGMTFAGAPTFRAAGLDLVSENWRGAFAPPGVSAGERRQLIETISRMTESRIWREALRRRGWTDRFLAGAEFEAAIVDEQQRVFTSGGPAPSGDRGEVSRLVALRYWPAGLAAATVPLLAALLWRDRRARRRERALNARLAAIDGLEPVQPRADGQAALIAAIQREFDAWKLSAAERDVAWFLLKGLPMKEIARLRGASERTVRQQAQAIYGKSGLEGRSDLAAHILDHCLMSTTDAPP